MGHDVASPTQPSSRVPVFQMVPALLAIQGLPVGPDTNEQEIQLQIFTAPLGLLEPCTHPGLSEMQWA